MSFRSVFVTLTAGLLAVCLVPIPARAKTLPVSAFIRHPEYTSATLSPNGQYLAVVMTRKKTGGNYELVVMKTKALLAGKVEVSSRIGLADRELLGSVFWANNDRVLIAAERYFGGFDHPYFDGNLFSVSAHGGRETVLMGAQSGPRLGTHIGTGRIHAYFGGLLSLLPKEKNTILVLGYHGRSNKPSAYRLNVVTGSGYRVATGLVGGGMLADHAGVVRLKWGFNQETGQPKLLYRPQGSMDWDNVSALVASNKHAAAFAAGGPIMFSSDNKSVYVELWSDDSAQTMGLYRYDFDTGEKTLLYANPNVNVGGEFPDYSPWIKSFDGKSLVGLRIMPGKPQTLALDRKAPRIQLLAGLKQALPNVEVAIVSHTRDGSEAVVRTWGDTVPPNYYLYTSKPKPKLTLLFGETPWIKPADLSPMKPINFKSRDGLTIHGYLVLPRGKKPKDLPMIVYVHGGPHGIRTDWGFDPGDFDSVAEQILANHGYAVLSLNYRGSGGYGSKFLKAGFRHWGDTMQNDLADGVHWAVKQGYADPKRVCIFGASYGGYAALMSAERFSDLYQCAIGYSGVYDLSMLESRKDIFDRNAGGRLYMKTVLGDNEKQLRAFSPADNADKLKAAVFLLHGGRDKRAPPAGYEEMAAAIKKQGTPLKTLYYRNEGHGFYKIAHREKAWKDMLAFFGKYIGPGATTSSKAGK